MSNTFAPVGFLQRGRQDGVLPNFGQSVRRIASSNTHTLTTGDVAVSLGTGYIDIATPGTVTIAGIFVGCKYTSVAQGTTVWRNKYLGSDAAGDVEAYVIDDPNATFLVQVGASGSGPVTIASVGANIGFAVGTPNTITGISGAYANFSTIETTSTLPFRILELLGTNPLDLAQNNDNASANNWIRVAFNNQDFKQTTGV